MKQMGCVVPICLYLEGDFLKSSYISFIFPFKWKIRKKFSRHVFRSCSGEKTAGKV